MQLHVGDAVRVPVVTDPETRAVRVYELVVDSVRQTANGPIYSFRDRAGPAICVREARLRWLQHHFERKLREHDTRNGARLADYSTT